MPKKTNGKTTPPETQPDASVPKPVDPRTPDTTNTGLPKPTVVKATPTKPSRRKLWWWIGGGVAVLLLAGLAGWMMFRPQSTNTNSVVTSKNSNSKVVTLKPRLIDGVMVPEDKTNPNLYAVMIENQIDSRPQSGLDQASVVYEALAEGGITRFMAIFPVGFTSQEVGPVRSARLYYVNWAEDYRPLYVHAGGSPQALSYIPSANIMDFNQFYNAKNFWRDHSRVAPHNLYTSSDRLFLGLKTEAPNNIPNYTGWQFKDEDTIDQRPSAQPDIVINYSSFSYKATLKYDRDQNVYHRYQGDTEHVMKAGTKITPKNVLVMFMKTGLVPGDDKRLEMNVIGDGRLLLFRDGQKFEGTWKKTAARDRLQFLDAQGQPMLLDRGQTWISAVPTDRQVTF